MSTSSGTKRAIVALTLLIPFSILSTHVLQYRNGYYALMTHLRDSGPYVLPDTSQPIVRHYTGNGPVDYWLQVLNCFFAPCFTNRETAVLAVEFVGALGVVLGVMGVEGMRRGTSMLGLTTVWGLIVQAAAFGVTMPFYALLSLLSRSSRSTPLSPSSSASLATLPYSLFLGYLIPTLLMAIPSPHVSNITHQRLVALWQIFPIYIALLQQLLPLLVLKPQAGTAFPSAAKSGIDRLFKFLIFLSRCSHLAAVVLAVRYLTDDGGFSVRRLLVPANAFAPVAVRGFADGVLAFLQYDYAVGMVAALVWVAGLRGLAVRWAASRGKGVAGVDGGVVEAVLVVVLEGPGSLVAKWAWEREVLLLGVAEGKGE